jgi:hypothetical protein
MDIEVVEIDDATGVTINETNNSSKISPNVNFGVGIEMLMNEKRNKPSTPKNGQGINIAELDRLENELNSLSDSTLSKSDATKKVFNDLPTVSTNAKENSTFTDTGSKSTSGIQTVETIKLNNDYNSSPKGTNNSSSSSSSSFMSGNGVSFVDQMKSMEQPKKDKTWDGYHTFNEIPVNPDFTPKSSATQNLSKEELAKKKFEYLRKLEDLERNKGVQLSKKYSMESDLDEMIGEYEMIMDEKEKSNSIKFQGKILMAVITGMEFLNNKFDPFDLKLDGWAESVNENIGDYDEIFAELHEKYRSKAKMAPELKLLFQLGGGAIMLHMTNTMFKSSLPGMDDIMRQNPELMQQFTQAAVNSMSQQRPGFSNFMGDMMNEQSSSSHSMPPRGSPPGPPPNSRGTSTSQKYKDEEIERRTFIPPASKSRSKTSRPDITMSRQEPTFTDAINLENNYSTPNETLKRNEMSGPKNLDDILSGIKPKSNQRINIPVVNQDDDMKSTISLEDFKSLKSDDNSKPLRSKRRNRSDKTTVSLNI